MPKSKMHPDDLWCTYHFAMRATPEGFKGNVVLLVQHLLSDAPALVRAFQRAGADPDDIFVLGIPYSTKKKVVTKLSKSGVHVTSPTVDSMHGDVENILKAALHRCEVSGQRLVIVEDGGYCVPLVSESEGADFVDVGVEQTTAGLRLDEAAHQKQGLSFPVVAVPRSSLKRDFEPPVIADAVRQSLERVLSIMHRSLSGCRVGLLGYGSLGSSIASRLKGIAQSVSVWDEDPVRRAVAVRENFEVPSAKIEVFRDSRIIIGATGFRTMTWDDLHEIRHDACLVSASSRRTEIDVEALETHSSSKKPVDDVGTEYQLVGGRRLTLVADGYPVNFFHSDSGSNREMDAVLSLLFQSALYGKNIQEKGIIELPLDWEQEIAQAYLDAKREE